MIDEASLARLIVLRLARALLARLLNFGVGACFFGFGLLAGDLALRGSFVLLGFAFFLQVTTAEDDADQLLDDASKI